MKARRSYVEGCVMSRRMLGADNEFDGGKS
jgi:hypothetical protein